eukprot:UN19669
MKTNFVYRNYFNLSLPFSFLLSKR